MTIKVKCGEDGVMELVEEEESFIGTSLMHLHLIKTPFGPRWDKKGEEECEECTMEIVKKGYRR